MSPRWIAGLSFLFILGTIISVAIEGAFFGQGDIDVLNEMLGFSAFEAGGLMAIPKIGIGFITHGLPKMLLWDYAFLDGHFVILRILLMSLSIAIVWGIVQVFLTVAQGLLSRFI